MPAPALTDRCPTWCTDHRVEDDGLTGHRRVLGFAGAIEVTLVCWVTSDQPDPVTELEICDTGSYVTGSSTSAPITLPLDAVPLDQLRELLDQALDLAGAAGMPS